MTEKELHAIFSANIKKQRGYHHLSQIQLAKKAEVSVNFINDLEMGKKWASPATMLKIAAVFKIEVYELLKPPGLFPDNFDSIVKKYATDMHAAVDRVSHVFLKEEASRKREGR
jgi:transcriptional regulator with XRE-family HTH domain